MTTITPLAAEVPYIAAEAPSFNTCIDSISSGFNAEEFVVCTPSITHNGAEPLFTVVNPLIVI